MVQAFNESPHIKPSPIGPHLVVLLAVPPFMTFVSTLFDFVYILRASRLYVYLNNETPFGGKLGWGDEVDVNTDP